MWLRILQQKLVVNMVKSLLVPYKVWDFTTLAITCISFSCRTLLQGVNVTLCCCNNLLVSLDCLGSSSFSSGSFPKFKIISVPCRQFAEFSFSMLNQILKKKKKNEE
jgi:hypothetical protein